MNAGCNGQFIEGQASGILYKTFYKGIPSFPTLIKTFQHLLIHKHEIIFSFLSLYVQLSPKMDAYSTGLQLKSFVFPSSD